MKYILASLFLICALGCGKDKDEKCYDCDVVPFNGGQTYKEYPCTDNIQAWQAGLKDANGNNLQSSCTER